MVGIGGGAATLDTLPEPELRTCYDTYRADRIEQTVVGARQAIVRHVASLLIASALFAFHWRWLPVDSIVHRAGGQRRP